MVHTHCAHPCFRAGTTYRVNVFGMFDGGESLPLVGQEMTTLSDTTVTPFLSSGKKLSSIFIGNSIVKLSHM